MNSIKPFPIPVRAVGPGSQPDEDDQLDYMVMPQGMSTWQPPALPEREDIAQQMGVQSVLLAVLSALERAQQGLPTQPIDLSPDRKSTRLNSSHSQQSRMPSSA